jgi:hypothetical protein
MVLAVTKEMRGRVAVALKEVSIRSSPTTAVMVAP